MRKSLTLWGMRIAVHGFAVVCTTMATVYCSLGTNGVQKLAAGFAQPGYQPEWARLALALGIGACIWALLVIGFAWGRERSRRSLESTVKAARGTVATEFLIIITPFLLLTSGLAQLAILNVTTILGHVAAYESARAAWVWYPETTRPSPPVPISVAEVRNRARIAAALVMAPTAPTEYSQSNVTDVSASHTRNFMRAYFTPGPATGTTATGFTSEARDADHRGMQYDRGFDKARFEERAARKFAMAYQSFTTFNLIPGGAYPGSPGSAGQPPPGTQVGVQFVYQQNLVFPWFAYIWGDPQNVAGRDGFFVPIRRSYTLEAQVRMD